MYHIFFIDVFIGFIIGLIVVVGMTLLGRQLLSILLGMLLAGVFSFVSVVCYGYGRLLIWGKQGSAVVKKKHIVGKTTLIDVEWHHPTAENTVTFRISTKNGKKYIIGQTISLFIDSTKPSWRLIGWHEEFRRSFLRVHRAMM